mmetsp:Transcript_35772/g.47211  ORF Transcript_35772/g.47211 Transcript_35772/m.47211 type:complete len:221 (+) Transcript_35772:138-800(+)
MLSTIVIFIKFLICCTFWKNWQVVKASEGIAFSECAIYRTAGGGSYPFKEYVEQYALDFFEKCGSPVSCLEETAGTIKNSFIQQCFSCGDIEDDHLFSDATDISENVKAHLYNQTFIQESCSDTCVSFMDEKNDACTLSCSSECKEATLNLIHQVCYWRYLGNLSKWHRSWLVRIRNECLSPNYVALAILLVSAIFGSIILLYLCGFILTGYDKWKKKRS